MRERQIQEKLEELRMKVLFLKANSRRKNMKFSNITESTSDTEEVLKNFLKKEPGYVYARTWRHKEFTALGRKEIP